MVTWSLPGWLRTKKQDAEATLLDQPGPLSSHKMHPAPKFSSSHTFPFNIIFSKEKGVHGPKDSLHSIYCLFPLLSPLGVSWDGMQGREVEKGASVSFFLPSGDSRVSVTTTPLSSSFKFPMALNVSAPSNRPYLQKTNWGSMVWNDLSKVTQLIRGTELRMGLENILVDGQREVEVKIHAFSLHFLNKVGTQEEITVIMRFGLMRQPACVKCQTPESVLVRCVCKWCRVQVPNQILREIELLSLVWKRQAEGNDLNQLCDKATSWLSDIFHFSSDSLGTGVDSLRSGPQVCNYTGHKVGAFLNYTGNEG